MEKIEIGVNVVNNASKQLSNVATDVTTFKRTIDGATKSVDGFDRVIQKFSLQAFSQGVLNVSTSAAQLVTSFSNLDRVANQVAASTVALHKAEDQILRKQTQLSQAIEKHGLNSERAAMITGELATAQDQLAVKTERVKLALDQQNDTYILMASNITNTVFGSLQTLGALKTMLIARYTASIAVTTLDTAATSANAHVHSFNAAQVTLAGVAKAGAIAPTIGYTGAVVGNTAATAAFTTVLWASLRAMIVHPFFAPAVLAALAIGVVAYAAHIDNLNKTMKQSTTSITDGSSAGYGFGEMATFTSPNIDGLSTSVFNLGESYTVAAEKVVNASKVIEQRSGRFGETRDKGKFLGGSVPDLQGRRFNKGTPATPTNTPSSPGVEQYTVEKFKAIMAQTKDASDFSSVISDIQPYLTELNRMKDIVIALRNSFDDLNGVQTGQATDMALDKMREKYTTLGLTDAMMRNLITHNKDLGNIQSENYSNEKSNLRELAEIKKKLISDYGFTKRGSTGDRFLKGETNYFMGESGIPFSGIINEKTKQITKSLNYRMAFDNMAFLLDYSKEQLDNGNWDPTTVARVLRDATKVLNSIPNISGSVLSMDNQIKIRDTQILAMRIGRSGGRDIFSNIGGGIGLGAIGLNASAITGIQALKGYSSLGNIMTNRMTQAGLISAQGRGSTSFPSGTVSGMPSRRSAFGNKKSRGGSRSPRSLPDSVQRENAVISLTKGVGSTTISDLSRLSGIDIMAGLGDPLALFKWVLPSNNQYISPAMNQARNNEIERVQSALASRIAMANSIISSGRSFVGQGISEMEARYGFDVVVDQEVVSRIESSMGYRSSVNVEEQVRATLASDEKYYNVDDRLRFTDRLAAISTGATTF